MAAGIESVPRFLAGLHEVGPAAKAADVVEQQAAFPAAEHEIGPPTSGHTHDPAAAQAAFLERQRAPGDGRKHGLVVRAQGGGVGRAGRAPSGLLEETLELEDAHVEEEECVVEVCGGLDVLA